MKQRMFNILAGSAMLACSAVVVQAQAPPAQSAPAPQTQAAPQTQGAPAPAPQIQYVQQCPTVYQSPPPNPDGPMVNIGGRHGNLRQAQGFLVESYEMIQQAQMDNDDQLGGHAQRAKDLITQAAEELRLAANVANREGR